MINPLLLEAFFCYYFSFYFGSWARNKPVRSFCVLGSLALVDGRPSDIRSSGLRTGRFRRADFAKLKEPLVPSTLFRPLLRWPKGDLDSKFANDWIVMFFE